MSPRFTVCKIRILGSTRHKHFTYILLYSVIPGIRSERVKIPVEFWNTVELRLYTKQQKKIYRMYLRVFQLFLANLGALISNLKPDFFYHV